MKRVDAAHIIRGYLLKSHPYVKPSLGTHPLALIWWYTAYCGIKDLSFWTHLFHSSCRLTPYLINKINSTLRGDECKILVDYIAVDQYKDKCIDLAGSSNKKKQILLQNI